MKSWPLALLLFVLIATAGGQAAAQAYAIGPGREAEVLALFAPHEMGGEVTPGCTLSNVSIARTSIRVTLSGPDDPIVVVLTHRSRPTGAPRSASFSFQEEGATGSAAAAVIMSAVRQNDDGAFWDARGLVDSVPQITTGVIDAAAHGPSSGRGWVEAVTTSSIRILRPSPATSLLAALFALLIALGSVFIRRGRAGGPIRQHK